MVLEVAQMVKRLPAMQETRGRFLGREDKYGMKTKSHCLPSPTDSNDDAFRHHKRRHYPCLLSDISLLLTFDFCLRLS